MSALDGRASRSEGLLSDSKPRGIGRYGERADGHPRAVLRAESGHRVLDTVRILTPGYGINGRIAGHCGREARDGRCSDGRIGRLYRVGGWVTRNGQSCGQSGRGFVVE